MTHHREDLKDAAWLILIIVGIVLLQWQKALAHQLDSGRLMNHDQFISSKTLNLKP